MSSKSLLLSVGSVSVVGTGVYAIYTSTQSDNKRIEIPDAVSDLDYDLNIKSNVTTTNATDKNKSTDSKK